MTETIIQTNYATETTTLDIPLSDELSNLLQLQAVRIIKVHGKSIMVNAAHVNALLTEEDSAINSEEDVTALLEQRLTEEDVAKIYQAQLHQKTVGRQFQINELENVSYNETEDLQVIVPKVKVEIEVIESAINLGVEMEGQPLMAFLPPQTEEEKIVPVHALTGNAVRIFLNELQTEEGGLDMNSQIQVYAGILTNLPDEDPGKKFALTQLRMAMQYLDVVSNRNLRLAITKLVKEGDE